MNNKIILRVKKDKINWWFQFSKGNRRVQLAWDPRRWGYWIEQYAEKVWLPNFLRDFTKILTAMEEDQAEIFALYEMPEISRGQFLD